MKIALIIGMMVASVLPANAATYALECTASCTAGDGTTQPAGTILGLVIWDGHSTWTPPSGLEAVLYTGQTVYVPTQPTPTTIPVFAFFGRFTSAEFNGLMANSTAAGIIAKMVAYGVQQPINVTDPIIAGYMAQAVSAGLLTSARSAQILNLAVSSP